MAFDLQIPSGLISEIPAKLDELVNGLDKKTKKAEGEVVGHLVDAAKQLLDRSGIGKATQRAYVAVNGGTDVDGHPWANLSLHEAPAAPGDPVVTSEPAPAAPVTEDSAAFTWSGSPTDEQIA